MTHWESLLEEIARQIVLAEASDFPSLARLHELLTVAQKEWDNPSAGQILKDTIRILDQLIFDSPQDKETLLGQAAQNVMCLQEMGRNAPSAQDAENETAPSPLNTGIHLQSDAEILRAFLGRQDSVLEEMETCILGLEKGREPGRLDALRRIIHTLKGEAGVLALQSVELVCHAVEDYLDKAKAEASADILLQAKDFFAQCFAALSDKEIIPPDSSSILSTLKRYQTVEIVTGADQFLQEELPPPSGAALPVVPAMQIDLALAGDTVLICDFVSEAKEHLHQAEIDLLALEANPQDPEPVNGLFRVFHTIKGVANFLNFEAIGLLSHATENMLDLARRGELTLSGDKIDAIFSAVDVLKRELESIKTGIELNRTYCVEPKLLDLIARIRKIALKENTGAKKLGQILVEAGKAEAKDVKFALAEQAKRPGVRIGEILMETGVVSAGDVDSALQKQQGQQATGKMRETIKVDTERLDKLLDTVGELVIAEAMVTQDDELANAASPRVIKNMQQLSKITRELQELGMSMRMVSIRSTFQKMARLVRDLAKKAEKEINFITSGEETELDKTVIENIGDPLVHMVRNSADHGIESPDERLKAGKPRTGAICLRSYQKGGSVHIEVEDDGRGLDKEAILAKAHQQGIIQPDQELDEQEIYKLIFRPGFSTAKKVTDVSGRGVGMDVVRKNIEALRGQIEIFTQKGQSTKFSIRLPLTLAIIDGMVIRVGRERYIVPTLSVLETFRPTRQDISSTLNKGEMIIVHGRLIPLFRLSRLFEIENAADVLDGIVMIVEDTGKQIGLLIDAILGQQQTVIKSLSQAMGKIPGVSGGAIMSDGKISLILDVAGIVRMAIGGDSADAEAINNA